MNIESLVDKILYDFELFSHNVRVMMLIDRGISNSNKGSKRWINKSISTNKKEFTHNLFKMLEYQMYINNKDVRLYLSLNSRNMDKSIKFFQHKQLDISTEQEKWMFYTRLNDKFCSALMQPENRAESLFLIDYDRSDSGIADLIKCLEIDKIYILMQYKTPNGWHIICRPFNPSLIDEIPNCEVKKDALILLNYL